MNESITILIFKMHIDVFYLLQCYAHYHMQECLQGRLKDIINSLWMKRIFNSLIDAIIEGDLDYVCLC